MVELASPHESGGVGASVRDLGATASQKKTPALTLDMTVRLLKSALRRPTLTVADAIEIMEYYLERNRIAKKSHYKSWNERHENVQFKMLL